MKEHVLDEKQLRAALAHLIRVLLSCCTRDPVTVAAQCDEIDENMKNVFLYEIDLSSKEYLEFNINGTPVRIEATMVHSYSWMIATIGAYITYMLGEASSRNSNTENAIIGITAGRTNRIMFTLKPNHSVNISFVTTNNTSRVTTINFLTGEIISPIVASAGEQ